MTLCFVSSSTVKVADFCLVGFGGFRDQAQRSLTAPDADAGAGAAALWLRIGDAIKVLSQLRGTWH